MDRNKYEIIRLSMERTAEALRRNNYYAVCADNCDEALELVENLLDDNSTVAVGGSMTLFEMGIINLLRSGRYEFYDRYKEGLTKEQINEVHKKAFFCDSYITSTNAVTENGELFNIDCRGNRVAAMIYGPESVIVVAGYNKIVKDADAAYRRVKEIAAPANAIRLNCKTPCTTTGKCSDCMSDTRICSDTVIMGRQFEKDRIKVILVGEELGY
jgi:hypothetical protein